MKFNHKSIKGGISNIIVMGHKRAEIQGREVNGNIIKKKKNGNKKHSENADTSTSVTFDLDV